MKNSSDQIEEFSKYLLVTIFSIFAFTSSAMLGSTILWVKVLYCGSLICAILSLSFGFKVAISRVNYTLNMLNKENPKANKSQEEVPYHILEVMKKNLQRQYHLSSMSLILLLAAIVFHFCSDNFVTVFIKNISSLVRL